VSANKRGRTRRGARLAAVQALYQMETAGKGILETMSEFDTHWIGREIEGIDQGDVDRVFFHDLVAGVLREQVTVDRVLDEELSQQWRLSRIEAVSRAILRAGVYELLFRREVAVASTIRAYLEVAQSFHDEEETSFINGTLDSVGRKLRPEKMKRRAHA
jgi:N utilization substance protein B